MIPVSPPEPPSFQSPGDLRPTPQSLEAAGGFYFFDFYGQGPRIDIIGNPAPIQVLLSYVNPLILSLILFMWMPYARLVNAMVISLKNTDFVHASRVLGASSTRTVIRHVIPNSISPAVVLMARDVGGVVIIQATFTFIGLGGNSPWGDMLSQGRSWIITAVVCWRTGGFIFPPPQPSCFSPLPGTFLGTGSMIFWIQPRIMIFIARHSGKGFFAGAEGRQCRKKSLFLFRKSPLRSCPEPLPRICDSLHLTN